MHQLPASFIYTARRQALCISTPLNDPDLTKSSISDKATIVAHPTRRR
jgi:hypothetical protein